MVKSKQSTDNPDGEDASVVEEVAGDVEAVEAPVEDEKATTEGQRPEEVDTPVAPAPVPITADEIRKVANEAKAQIVAVAVEPAREALAFWSQTVRDTVSGALSGLLGNKKRDGD